MNTKKLLKSKRKGTVMALMLVALMVLLLTGVGLLGMGLRSRIFALRTASDIAARSAADAGLAKALFEMNKKLKVKPWNDSTLPQITNEVLPGCDATFSYTITGNSSSGYTVESAGNYSRAERKVNATLRLQTPFEYGIFVQSSMVLKNGTTIDWYNYNADDKNLQIGTNSTAGAAITAKLGVIINGDVVVGVDADPGEVVDNAHEAVITGDVYAMPEEYELPSVTVPQYLQLLPSQGVLTNSTTISSSAKYDSINLSAGNIAKIDGAVTLYVIGNLILDNSAQLQIVDASTNPDASLTVYLGGNLVNKNGGLFNNETLNAGKLKIYGLDTCTRMDFMNSGVFYGAIYAPNADVHLYNSFEFFGSVIANSFRQDVNADLHYDASLRNATVNDEAVRFVVKRWCEQ